MLFLLCYHMNGVNALTVKSAGVETEVSTFLSDMSLSKHLHTEAKFSTIPICNRRGVRLLFWRLWKHLAII